MIAYAWILDANTRKLVWVMTNQNTDRLGRGYNRKFDDDISLPAGEYEVYFSTFKSNLFFKHGVFSFVPVISEVNETQIHIPSVLAIGAEVKEFGTLTSLVDKSEKKLELRLCTLEDVE